MTESQIRGFGVRLDLAHDLGVHMWVDVLGRDRVRVGMDPLGIETSGTLSQLAFGAVGTDVGRGEPFGSLEAEKFVGALVSPISGRLVAVNDAVAADPGIVERDPYGAGWLVELTPADLEGDLAALATDPAEIEARFAARVAEYRKEGVLAE